MTDELAAQIRDLESLGEEERLNLDAERAEREALARRIEGLEAQVHELAGELVDRARQLSRAREIEETLLLQARALHRSAADLDEALSTRPEGPGPPDPE